MSKSHNLSSTSWKTVTKHQPCVHCGKPDWCARSWDLQFDICRRHNDGTAKAEIDSSGSEYFIYYVGESNLKPRLRPDANKIQSDVDSSSQAANANELNEVYSFLFSQLTLTKTHAESLQARGLSREAIVRGMYKSMYVSDTQRAIDAVFQKFDSFLLERIPGFYFVDGYGRFARAPGILIPVRNTNGLIVGLRIRLDNPNNGSKYLWVSSASKGGASSGALIHTPIHVGSTTEKVRITEGELKADVATNLTGLLTISLPGITVWRNVLPVLKTLNAKTVVLAIDSDAKKNLMVAHNLSAMAVAIRDAGIAIEVETWSDKAKGIDDALMQKMDIQTYRGDEAFAVIDDIVRSVTDCQDRVNFENAKNTVADALTKIDDDGGVVFLPTVLDSIVIIQDQDQAEWTRIRNCLKGKVHFADLKRSLINRRQKSLELKAIRDDVDSLSSNLNATNFERGSKYQIKNHCIVLNKTTENGITPIQLSNFTAKIVAEEIIDDGIQTEKHFLIEGTLQDGSSLPEVRVSSDKFAFMNWVIDQWGVCANVGAGFGKKDHLREAIQELSKNAKIKRTYGHLGWVCKNGEWIYLYSGGAISKDGTVEDLDVDLYDTKLRDYGFPPPVSNDGLAASIRDSLSILEIAPPRITYPILAATYCAPLGEMHPIDFSLALYGITGRGKTQLAALSQAHFGEKFHGKHLPGNWSSTANSLEKQSFLAKDAIFTIDDFAPQQTIGEAAKLNQAAERIFRSQGNRSGRGRLNSDMKCRPEYFPRGLILSTGEDLPKTQSVRARLLIIEFNEKDLKFESLGPLQDAARDGIFATSMAGFIQWLASRIPQFKESLPKRQHELRQQFSSAKSHRRAPEIAASLMMAFEIFLNFAVEKGAIDLDLASHHRTNMTQAMISAMESQEPFQASEDPAHRFLDLVGASLTSGRAHLADAKTGGAPHSAESFGWRVSGSVLAGYDADPSESFQPQGERIGWVNDTELLLSPEAAFAAAQKLANDQKNALSISEITLWKQLAEKGLILKEEGRNKIKRTVKGGRPYVLVFPDKGVFYQKASTASLASVSADMRGA